MSYRSDEEKIYFGSDLNKFISENCSAEAMINDTETA